ncbi:PAS domain-containing protein [Oceanibaculum nanhaiense]|uniref:PAS domain-containing protein n=1 Tax=Oceanibaculum nanhaiense TaxID=1909734 RepID=UPI003F70D364
MLRVYDSLKGEGIVIADPAMAIDPDLKMLFEYWKRLRRPDGDAHYLDLDFSTLPRRLLPWLYLIEVERGESIRLKVRTVGELVTRHIGIELRGRYLDEVKGAEETSQRMRFCVERKLPYRIRNTAKWDNVTCTSYEALVLPLCDEAGQVAYVLTVAKYDHVEPVAVSDSSLSNLNAPVNLPRFTSSVLDEGFAYWDRIRGDRRMPRFTDIDAIDIPKLLPHALVLDVEAEPLDFRYRLIGEHVGKFFRKGLKGRSFREFDEKKPGNIIFDTLATVVYGKLPRFGRSAYAGENPKMQMFQEILLPLSDDGETVNRILIFAEFRGSGSAP